ncbi:hypothetical protein Peur_050282 [Populus x canadensis]
MTSRIAPGVGANVLGQHSSERNQDATAYVRNLGPQLSEDLLWELFVQAGPVVNVYVPKDRVTNLHQGYGFVEFRRDEDSDYASQDKKSLDAGANLFIGNLDPDVDEKLLHDTFSAFGVIVTNPKIMRDPETGNSHGFGFISYDSFEASDAAIEAMNGQYLCNRQITVSYAYKKDTKGGRHGTPAGEAFCHRNREFWLQAIQLTKRAGPILCLLVDLFASGPATLPTHANGAVMAPVPPRPFADGAVAPGPVPALHRPPPPNAAFTPMQVAGQPAWQGQPLQQGQPMPPPPVQFRPPPPNIARPPPQAAPMFPRPPPQHMAMEAQPQVWQQPPPPPPPPPQHFSGRPPMPQMLMQPRPPPNARPPPPSS